MKRLKYIPYALLVLLLCTLAWARIGGGPISGGTGGTFDEAGNYTPTGTWDFSGATLTLDNSYQPLDADLTALAANTLANNLDQNGKLILEDDETAFTDSDAPSPDLSGAHQLIKFTDDATTDVDTITGFSNIVTGVVYYAVFEDQYWTIDFSGTNLKGHGGIDVTTVAGDSMIFWTVDGTTIECIFSRVASLSINQYNEMPFDTTPDSDDSWAGPTGEFLAGEALSQWDLVYITHDTGTPEIKKWDADLATYKYYKPIGVVIESGGISDTSTGTVGIGWGIGRNDGWTFTDSSDEGKTVYGTTTAGAYSTTAPSTAGDIVCAVAIVLDEDELQFNFGLCATVEVGS